MINVLVTVLIFAAAVLYSSVGHAGASGYLAVMALCGVAPDLMRPTALALNILVAGIATLKFSRGGCFSWPLFWPFAVTSVPFAFLGGTIALPGRIFKPLLGTVLLFAAYRLFHVQPVETAPSAKSVPIPKALGIGAAIGLLSGCTGVGGSIFLGPTLLLTGWSDARRTAGISAAFNLVNSAAGLAGFAHEIARLPRATAYWAVAACLGALVGTEYGARRLGGAVMRRLLAVILVGAGLRLVAAN